MASSTGKNPISVVRKAWLQEREQGRYLNVSPPVRKTDVMIGMFSGGDREQISVMPDGKDRMHAIFP